MKIPRWLAILVGLVLMWLVLVTLSTSRNADFAISVLDVQSSIGSDRHIIEMKLVGEGLKRIRREEASSTFTNHKWWDPFTTAEVECQFSSDGKLTKVLVSKTHLLIL